MLLPSDVDVVASILAHPSSRNRSRGGSGELTTFSAAKKPKPSLSDRQIRVMRLRPQISFSCNRSMIPTTDRINIFAADCRFVMASRRRWDVLIEGKEAIQLLVQLHLTAQILKYLLRITRLRLVHCVENHVLTEHSRDSIVDRRH